MDDSKQHIRCEKLIWLTPLIIGCYYAVAVLFSVNFPISDDFSLLDFVTNVATSSDPTRDLQWLFAQHNEHRIATTRLVYLLDYWIFHTINFKRLILIGNLFQFATFYILIKQLPKKIENRSCILFIFACMFFQFSAAESMLWAMTAVSNYLILTLTALSLSLLSKNDSRYDILALLASTAGVFTQGNGLLIPPIGIAYLVSQKRYYSSLIMTAVTIVLLFMYFHGYQTPRPLANPLDAQRNIGMILIFAISFTGSALGLGGSHHPLLTHFSLVPTLILGSFIWVITAYSLYKKTYRDGNIYVWLNIFVILSAIITATSRINFGLSQSMVSRYHIYSTLAIASTTVLLAQLFELKHVGSRIIGRIYKTTALSSAAYFVASFSFALYFYLVVYAPARSGDLIFPDVAQAAMILDRAEANHIFVPRQVSDMTKSIQ